MDLVAMKILIAEDEDANVTLLTGILQRAGFSDVHVVQDGRSAVEAFRSLRPDLLLLDFHMPHLNGLAVMETLRPDLQAETYFPVVMITADVRPELRQKALASGAKDFLNKPFNPAEVRLRIRNLLEARSFHLQLRDQNVALERRVRERTQQLERSQVEMLVRLARAAEYRDDESGEHVWRVAHGSMMLARELGLPNERCDLILRAARLHDVGKIGIPDGILLKPGRLTPQEFEVVKSHTTVGAQLLSGSQSKLMQTAELVALTHHERWDGTGYPRGLKGEDIPIESRILAVVDAYDALTHDRAHRRAVTPNDAIAEIRAHAGRQFDPAVVDAFGRLFDRGEVDAPAE